VGPYSQKEPFARRHLSIQGDSVRAIWAKTEDEPLSARKPLRRDPQPALAEPLPTDNMLHLRIAEEIDHARQILDLMGEELAGDPTVVMRHETALQSFDIVGQVLCHLASVIGSGDPEGTIQRIGMAELKARLLRRSAL
jgi:hypothetical protein